MAHIFEFFDPSQYIQNFELKGEEHTLTIRNVVGGEVEGEDGKKAKKPIVYFRDWPKPLVIGKRVAKVIVDMYGTDPEGWVGKRITIYPTREKGFGEMQDVVRVRKGVPRAPRPEPTSRTPSERVDEAISRIRSKTSVAGVEKVLEACAGLILDLQAANQSALLESLNKAATDRIAELKPATPTDDKPDFTPELEAVKARLIEFAGNKAMAQVEISGATNGVLKTFEELDASAAKNPDVITAINEYLDDEERKSRA
jgi:hypothetical protein